MRTYPECVPCILGASLRAGRLAGAEEGKLWQALQEAATMCAQARAEDPPLALGAAVATALCRTLGEGDPFEPAKRKGNTELLALYPDLKARVRAAPDPLWEGLHLAAAANALDLGVQGDTNFLSLLRRALTAPFTRWDFQGFATAFAQSRSVLYLADNAGEIVVDRILMEEFLERGKRVTLAVRGGPILNDVTLSDLAEVGLPPEVEVITTGAHVPGVFLPLCSPEFRTRLSQAELVVSKGMGNFEGLSQERGPIFFLLQAKCAPVAQEVGVKVGELVLIAADDLATSQHGETKG